MKSLEGAWILQDWPSGHLKYPVQTHAQPHTWSSPHPEACPQGSMLGFTESSEMSKGISIAQTETSQSSVLNIPLLFPSFFRRQK